MSGKPSRLCIVSFRCEYNKFHWVIHFQTSLTMNVQLFHIQFSIFRSYFDENEFKRHSIHNFVLKLNCSNFNHTFGIIEQQHLFQHTASHESDTNDKMQSETSHGEVQSRRHY